MRIMCRIGFPVCCRCCVIICDATVMLYCAVETVLCLFIFCQKVRLFGWKSMWVVLEKGVLSVFASRYRIMLLLLLLCIMYCS